jgi:hypothetical protein
MLKKTTNPPISAEPRAHGRRVETLSTPASADTISNWCGKRAGAARKVCVRHIPGRNAD